MRIVDGIFVPHYPKTEILPNPSGAALKDGAFKVIKFKEINVIKGGDLIQQDL